VTGVSGRLSHRTKAYYTLHSYRGEGPFLHWLGIVCTRVGYDFWSRQNRARVATLTDCLDRMCGAAGDALGSTEAAEIAHALLARLSKPDRLVLTLLYLEDCSTKEIAKRTGWNHAVVKMRAYRARRRIKAIAEENQLLEKLGWIR
jgi:RNA polymerase sigma-70 factor (ECF subfamily)